MADHAVQRPVNPSAPQGIVQPAIRLHAAAVEFYINEGCHIRELSNTPDDPEVSIAEARVEPGGITRWHRLSGVTERYVILAGAGIVEIGGLAATAVGPGDVVLIPPGCPQRIANTGATDLRFLAICSPRFSPGCYEDIDAEPLPPSACA